MSVIKDKNHVVNICKIGHGKHQCSYLTLVSNFIYECSKEDVELKEIIDFRRKAGELKAKGDNCKGYNVQHLTAQEISMN